MTPSVETKLPAARLQRRQALLGGSALCGAVMLMALPAQAQTLPAVPNASALSAVGALPQIAKSADGLTMTVDLKSARSVIHWDSFHVSGNDTVNFNFQAGTDIVLNRTTSQVKVEANGTVTGTTPSGTGGNIWFYSPAGVMISPDAKMTAGNFVFARGDDLVDMDFLTSNAPLQFLRSASDSLIQITTLTATTATISATGDVVLTSSGNDLTATTVIGKGSVQVSGAGAVTLDEVASTGGAVTIQALAGDTKILTSAKGATGLSISSSAQAIVQLAETTTSGDVVINGDGAATVITAHSKGDLKITGPSVTLTDGDATGDVLVTASNGIAKVIGSATAGDDVEVKAGGGDVDASGATLTSKGSGADDGHVLAESTDHSVTLGAGVTQGTGAKAGNVTVDGHTGVTVGSGSDSSQDFIATSTNGSVSVGSATAKNDLTATATAAGTSASVTAGAAGHDIKVTGPAASLTSGDTDTGDILVTASAGAATIGNHANAGDDVEVKATGGNVEAGSATLTSKGAGADDGHVLAQSIDHSVNLGAGVTQGAGAKAGDVTANGKTGVTVGSGSDSSHDFIATSANGSVSVGSAKAKNDLTATASAASTSTSVTTGVAGHDIKVTGPTASLTSGDTDTGDILVTASAGAATIGNHANAGDDVELVAGGNAEAGSATLTSKGAGSDDGHVLVQSDQAANLGAGVTLGTGATAGDVVVKGTTGVSVGSGSNSSRDFIVTGPTVDLASGRATRDLIVTGTVSASVGVGRAGRDIQVTGPTASLTSGDTDTGDILVTASAGAATIGNHANAGDDVEVKATGGNVEAGSATLTSKGAGADDGHVLAQSIDHSVNLGAGVTQGTGAKAGDVTVDGHTGVVVGSGSDSSQDFIATPPTGDVNVLGSVHAHRDVIVSPVAGSVTGAGAFSADRDIAISTSTGSIGIASANAGDDVVMRAPLGAINASGDIKAGRDNGASPAADADGAGDALNAAHPFLDFDAAPTTIFSTVGYDVNLAAQAIHVGGSTVAGHQPSTDALGAGGPVDTTTSDVRIQTLVGPTPAAGLDPSISLGAVIATRDIQIDSYKAITTGGLQAGRDIAVLGRGGAVPGGAAGNGGDVQIGSAHAGDDVVIYSIFGHAHVLGDVTSGLTFAELQPNTDITIDGATQAADQLAIYLHYFDLDETSKPGKPTGAILIRGETVTVGGNMQAVGSGSDIALRSAGDLTVQGDAHAGANATFTTEAAGGATLSLNTVTAEGAVSVDGGAPGTGNTVSANELHANGGDTTVRGHVVNLGITTASGDVIVTGDTVTMGGTSAGGDVAVSGGSVTLGTTSAGDDVVVRAGDITLHGDVSAGGGTDSVGAGDALVSNTAAVTLEGVTFGVGGRKDVDIKAANTVKADAGTTLTANDPFSNVRVQAGGDIAIGNAVGAIDVLIDGGAKVTTGNLSSRRDVGVRSTSDTADVVVGNVSAGDDVVIRGAQNVTTGGLTAHGEDSNATDQAGDLMFNVAKSKFNGELSLAGQNVDVRSTNGSVQVGGANADTEVRIQTEEATGGSVTTTGTVKAGENVLLDGRGVTATGMITATHHDVAVRGRDGLNVSLADASAGDDVVIRTDGNVTTGNVSAGGGAEGGGFGERLVALTSPIVLEGHAYDLTGHNVDIKAGGVGTGGLSATNDVRVQAPGSIGVGGANAGRDVLIDAGQQVTTGGLAAGRDVGVRSTGDGFDVAVADVSAGDDVVIRSAGNITTGALTAQGADSTAPDQAGDLMFNAAKSHLGPSPAGDFSLTGQNVDVRSTKGSIQAAAATADTEVRIQTEELTGGSVNVGGVTAGENVLLDGKGVTATGKLTATNHDVAVRGREGSDVTLGDDVSAGDDVVIRTGGNLTTANVAAGGGADGGGLGERLRLSDGAIVLEGHVYDLSGHNVDIKAGGVGTGGLSASNDVRVQAGGIGVGGATAGRDVLIDGSRQVTTGNLTAGRDVGVRSTGDGLGFDVVVADVSAKDDVVIRGKQNITTGALTAHGQDSDDSNATDQAGDLMFGAAKTHLGAASTAGDLTLAGRNVDVRTSKGSILVKGSANADGDARFQTEQAAGGSIRLTNGETAVTVTAGQNILLDGSTVETTGALVATNADVAVRARAGAAKLLDVTAGDDVAIRATGAATAGLVTTKGKPNSDGLADKLTVDAGKLTVEGHAFDLGGSDIDVVAGSATIDTAHAVGSVRIKIGSAAKLTTGTADGGEILIDSAGSVTAGVLTANGDVAVRATGGDVDVNNATAGDDIVLRASGSVRSGTLIAGGGNSDGAGDILFGANPTTLGGNLTLAGGAIDVKANGSATVGTATAGADIHLQAGGEARLSGVGTAGRDILLDGGSVAAGDLHANGGDVAVYARSGGVTLGSATAGDDIAIRASSGVNVTGVLTAGSGGDSNGVADRLIGVAGGIAVAGAVFDLNGAAIDVRGADIGVGGAISAAGASGNVRLQSAGGVTLAAASATADVLLDAGGQVTTQALTAGRDIGVRSAGGTLTIASASAGDDVVLRGTKAITVTGALTARGDTDGVGAGDLVFNADATDLGGALDLTGSNVDVRSSGGSISAMGTINAAADVRLQTIGAGDVTTGDIVAGRDVLLDGATATAGAVKGGRDIAARARAGAIALGSADAKDDLVLRATGDILVAGTASAQGGADGVGAGDRLFNTDRTKLNGDFDLAGANVDAKSSGGAIGFTGQVSAGRDVRLQTTGGGAITTAAVEAVSGDILADGAAVSASGQLKAGGDVALRARTGTVEVASISAGDDIAIRAAGAFKANGALSSGSGANANGAADRLISTSESGMIVRQTDPATAATAEGFALAGGDIDIRSGGNITLGGLTAAGKSNVNLQSPGDIALGTVSADSIFARAASLHMGGVWTATTARIESTAAGGVSLGTGVTGGMELSNDQINLINAATLQIFAGDTSGTMRGTALQIGTLSIDVAKVKTALQLYAGSGVEVRITGVFAPSSTAANSTVVSIGANAIAGNWTPKSIKVIADNGGAIGFSTTRDGRAFDGVRAFGGVELNATNDILIGYQDFIDKMAATNAADVANVAKSFHAAQGPDGSRILITAGALSLRADGKVAQQDTSAVGGLTRTGVFLIGSPTPGTAELSVDSMTHSTLGTVVMPQYVELYGALKSNTTVLANESTALSNLIVLLAKPSQYYRLNTCVIFQTGTCSPAGGPPNTNIAPDRLTALNILDRTDAAGAADPTVASATNEEIWKSPE